ncbi:nitroreductase family deazaflavin-dependent oxidoreductase [Mycobacterium sp. pUA109]|uniref:nitroreductase family deazaflavin-dependent oxidoreductase n=1 Tax=Mycobacterium sp. pUA109 TaxID=3238982 RepID=UPI00351BDE26
MAATKPPRWLKPVNKVMIAMQKLGIPTGPPMILTVPGRKTGQPRSTPMTPFTLDGQLYTVAGFPNADWARNARAAGSGTLRHGRTTRPVRIVELAPEEARPVLRAFPVQVPIGAGFLKRAGLVQDGTPEEVEALAGQIAVFRFDPTG